MESQDPTPPSPDPEITPAQKSAFIWAFVSFGFAIFIHVFNSSYTVTHAGFFHKCFSVIVASILGTIGAVIGDGIRRFAMPDAMLTSGIGETIKAKLFWMVGPQLIGMAIGVFVGAGVVLR